MVGPLARAPLAAGAAGALSLLAGLALILPPQRVQQAAEPYQPQFTFTRLRYVGANPGSSLGGFGRGRGGFGGNSNAWNHDYPRADLHMQDVLKDVTTMEPVTGSSVILDLEDPAIFQHPILYMSEPGYWRITEQGAENLRTFLLKGGFIIFDDFDGPGHWESWLAQIKQVLPEYTPIEIGPSHAVFQTFFQVDDIYIPNPLMRDPVKPTYLGIFEHNDPNGRMMALVNYNADLAEYWEWSTSGYLPIDPTNDAFRIGINYFIYGMTH